MSLYRTFLSNKQLKESEESVCFDPQVNISREREQVHITLSLPVDQFSDNIHYLENHRERMLLREKHHRTYQNLTLRQKQVLQLIGKGRCPEDIANELNISKRTVEKHREAILQALQVQLTAELVCIATAFAMA